MKFILGVLISLVLVLFSFSACKTDDPVVDTEKLCAVDTIGFTAAQDAGLLVIKTNSDWTIESNQSWISFSATSGKGETAILVGVENNISKKRQATFRIKTSKKEQAVVLWQSAVPSLTYNVGGVNFRMILVEGGTFAMGDEKINTPLHNVQLSDYYICETEITNELWKSVMGNLPYDSLPQYSGHDQYENLQQPVTAVSWNDVVNSFLPAIKTKTGINFRLPTEAEWEFAALGGNKSLGYKFAGSNNLADVGWNLELSEGQKQDVTDKLPNELMIYDMSGNAAEWCSDWFENTYTSNGLSVNPQGPQTGTYKVVRGGNYQSQWGFFDSNDCYSKKRGFDFPNGSVYDAIGFRLVFAFEN